jgi:hypothetical protein
MSFDMREIQRVGGTVSYSVLSHGRTYVISFDNDSRYNICPVNEPSHHCIPENNPIREVKTPNWNETRSVQAIRRVSRNETHSELTDHLRRSVEPSTITITKFNMEQLLGIKSVSKRTKKRMMRNHLNSR